MANWRTLFNQSSENTTGSMATRRQRLMQRLQLTEPILVIPYRGFGTKEQIFLQGRVLVDQRMQTAHDDDTLWENLHTMYLRFASREVADVQVQVDLQDQTWTTTSDREGYFQLALTLARPLPITQAWHEVPLTLLDLQLPTQAGPVTAMGQVMTPTVLSTFGVISDIDDTIVATQATNLLKMARIVFLNNARTRLPFAGVAAFYRALQRGRSGGEQNPVFYVSSSPWNLYDLLVDFLAIHEIPAGPLFLQDYGIDKHKFITVSHRTHKLAAFQRILHTYPMLPFILIGDSGQADPEIYAEVVKTYPGRIQAIYIRDVSTAARDATVQKLIAEANKHQVEMLLVPDTLAAAHHAVQRGFIQAAALSSIGQEQRKDIAAPNDLELLVEENLGDNATQ